MFVRAALRAIEPSNGAANACIVYNAGASNGQVDDKASEREDAMGLLYLLFLCCVRAR